MVVMDLNIKCSICLKSNLIMVNANDSDENDVKWSTKVQCIIPEMIQVDHYMICQCCIEKLEDCLKFRNMLANLLHRWTSLLKTEDETVFKEMLECDKSAEDITKLQNKVQNDCANVEDYKNISQQALPVTECKIYTFTCYDCNIKFILKEDLLQHIRAKHHKRKMCSNKKVLQNHMNDEHKIMLNEFICLHCSKRFESVGKLDSHKCSKNHCSKCGVLFRTKKLLYIHLKTCKEKSVRELQSVEVDSFLCSNCNNFYTTEKNLQAHEKFCKKDTQQTTEITPSEQNQEHSNNKKRRGRKSLQILSCEICGETFNYAKLVVEHCVSMHSIDAKNVKPYACTNCEHRFSSLTNLHQHIKYHEKNRSKICTICGKAFITGSDLMVHEYTHFNRRNYKCTDCGNAFNTNKNLRTHILVVHTDHSLWKYHCNLCDKRFPLKSNYEQHCRRHTGEKPHICHICGKSFISSSELKRHVDLHTNIKLFKCIPCNKEYKTRRSHKAHIDKKHSSGDVKNIKREKSLFAIFVLVNFMTNQNY